MKYFCYGLLIGALTFITLSGVAASAEDPDLREGQTLQWDGENFLAFQYLPQGGLRIHYTRDGNAGLAEVDCGATREGKTAIRWITYLDKDKIWIHASNFRMWDEAVLLDLPSGLVERHLRGMEMIWSPDRRHVAYTSSHIGKRRWGDAGVFVDALMLYPQPQTLNGDGVGNVRADAKKCRDILEAPGPLRGGNPVILDSPHWNNNDQIECIIGERERLSGTVSKRKWLACTHYVFSGVDAPRGDHYTVEERRADLDPELFALTLGKYEPGVTTTSLTRLDDFVTSRSTRIMTLPYVAFQPRPEPPPGAASSAR